MAKYEKPSKLKKLRKQEFEHPCLAVCAGKHCAKAGTKHILHTIHETVSTNNLEDLEIVLTKCQDHCDDGPVVTILPGEFPYVELTPQAINQILNEHIGQNQPVLSLLHKRMRKRLERLGS